MIWNEDAEKTTGISREVKNGISKITYVDIVRCKECIRSHDVSDISPDLPYMCEKFGRLLYGNWVPSFHDGEWFCADGKRRDDDA